MTRSERQKDTRRRLGLGLVETLMSVLLVGGLLVVALDTVGSTTAARQTIGKRGLGNLLAQDLMTEILHYSYEEPVDTPLFGREGTESASVRTEYDDVDDYHNWTASPPESRDGTAIPDRTNWSRTVSVEWVTPADLTNVVVTDSGVKRITVTASMLGTQMASLVSIRVAAYTQAAEAAAEAMQQMASQEAMQAPEL